MKVKKISEVSIDLVCGGACHCWCEELKNDLFVGGGPCLGVSPKYWGKIDQGNVADISQCIDKCAGLPVLDSRVLICI